MLSKTTREAAKIVDESVNRLKATLAKQGKTLDDWLEEQRIETEKIKKRVEEKRKKQTWKQ